MLARKARAGNAEASSKVPNTARRQDIRPIGQIQSDRDGCMQHHDPTADLQELVLELMSQGYPGIDQVAGRLDVSVRTLQRRLAERGLTYRRLVDENRLHMACRLLEDPRARVGDVAVALGYADQSNFGRAFMRVAGMSPSAYRRLTPKMRRALKTKRSRRLERLGVK